MNIVHLHFPIEYPAFSLPRRLAKWTPLTLFLQTSTGWCLIETYHETLKFRFIISPIYQQMTTYSLCILSGEISQSKPNTASNRLVFDTSRRTQNILLKLKCKCWQGSCTGLVFHINKGTHHVEKLFIMKYLRVMFWVSEKFC